MLDFCMIVDGQNGPLVTVNNKDEEMLEEIEMGKNPKECFAEMSKNRKMQDGLGS